LSAIQSRTVDGMPRPLRIPVAGGLYHITAHSNLGRVVFQDDREREHFVGLLNTTVDRCGWSCRSWCLLSTHYHLYVLTPEPDLSAGIQYLNGRYAQWANWSRNERSHIFEGRFGSVSVENESHSLEIHRYIALNPVRAGLVRNPQDWPWSSFRATVGDEPPPEFLDVRAVLAEFGASVSAARRRFRLFVREGLEGDKA
jgi:REP element-mobilizing transposase RayT